MNRYIKSAIASLLIAVIVISTYIPSFAVGEPTSYSSSYNSGTRNVVATTLNGTNADNYYNGSYEYDVLSEKSANEIFNSLRSLMRTTHKTLSSYNDCHYEADKTDCENGNGRITLIYTSYSATQSQWNGWNREHVWPQSLGGGNTSGGGADMHHIRPSDATVNSTRGNKKYGEVNGGKAVNGNNPATGILGGYSGTYFEPLDNVKGDVARICLYVYVRWGSDWGADSITEVFQSVDVLLEWCALDPVDTWELGRNEVVEAYQGNRNVFIDYPEYAWLIFGKEPPASMTTPSGEAADGNGGGGTVTPDPTPDPEPVCTHINKIVKNATKADCYNEGYTGDTYCLDCGEKLYSGSKIPTTNAHSFGDWELNENGEYVKHCSVCGASATLSLDSLLGSIDNDAEKILILLTLGITDSALLDALSK